MTITKRHNNGKKTTLLAAALIITGNVLSSTTETTDLQFNPQTSSALEVKELKLTNGMTVWLNEDHSQPKVFGAVVVKVGSNDCPNTGMAHYFEHILFKGTDKIGTTDYKAEKPWLDSISAQYDILSRTNDNTERIKIQKHINELSIKASEYAIPNEFSNLIAKYGGSGLNAGTSYDHTFYYNTFVPQFIEQWCKLNSERLISPVFRLFQGELETVYEEKNMYSDNVVMPVIEKFMSAVYSGTPYEYPIIGSTDNLKNPKLSEMQEFYDKYYVAGNMGLILCGDIDTKTIKPLLEKTFGHIKPGNAPQRQTAEPKPFDGKTTIGLKLPIPIIKATGLCHRGPKAMDKDDVVMTFALQLLANEQETGMLDSLADAGKWLGATAMAMPQKDAGAVILGVIPNIPFGSKKKAERLLLKQIERLKNGDFSETTLNHLKMESIRNFHTNLENMNKRANMMVSVFTQLDTWNDYLALEEQINRITKEDIVRVARKYINDNYIRMVKKFGIYSKDRLTQPGYKPVKPKNTDVESEYAKALDSIPVKPIEIRTIDFQKDVNRIELGPLATLYTAHNPMNNIFTMNIKYRCGTIDKPILETAESFIKTLGTDSLSKTEFGKSLQKIGTTMEQYAGNGTFTISLSGFESQLENTLKLLRHFMNNVKPEKKKLDDEKKSYKIAIKSFDKDYTNVADAMMEKVMFGNESSYLKYSPTSSEINNLTGEKLINTYKELQNYECDITYTGRTEDSTVERLIRKYLNPGKAMNRHKDTFRKYISVDKPTVYVYLTPKARQNIIGTYTQLPKADTWDKRAPMIIWGNYFGKDMSSLMFQEIREIRSYAYYAGGEVQLTPKNTHPQEHTAFITKMGTQADKTFAALSVLDSLMNNMPVKEKQIEIAKQSYLNNMNNNYPSFRGKADYVAEDIFKGYKYDTNKEFAESIRKVSTDDVYNFYVNNVKPANRAIFIVGKLNKEDIEKLKNYGEVKILTKKDIINM